MIRNNYYVLQSQVNQHVKHVVSDSDILSIEQASLYNISQIQYFLRPTLDPSNMENNGKGKYTTVHIPTALAEAIDEIIESERYAYSSRSEFIKDAIRRFLEYYNYYPASKRNSRREELHLDLTQEDIAKLLTQIVKNGAK